tara:strand:- start:288 stop:536 length:249 start_codon:yes stop_codon:yes gene_type:complete
MFTRNIKWDYITENKRNLVFEDLVKFNETKDKDTLERLFNYYNEFVSFKYSRVRSNMTCGKCVGAVIRFFNKEYKTWLTAGK